MLGTVDWVVIGLYFFVLAAVVWWSARKQDTAADYFLAGRNLGWFTIGASLFATNIGSEHIVGLAGNGATSGMAMAHYELHSWIVLLLAWIFVPFYYRSGVFTIPEFLEKRFDARSRWVLSIVSIIAYIFTKVSVTVYAGALVFQTLLPDLEIRLFSQAFNSFWIGALSTVVLTGIYTVFGGLRAVIYTDTMQAILLILSSFFVSFFGLRVLGGWGELKAICANNATNFTLWRPLSDPDFPWLGILIASPVVGIWYWCTDQYIVQRTLAAKNLLNARRGALWGATLKVLPIFIFLIPGLIGYALHQKGVIMLPLRTVNGVETINGDSVFPTMVTTLLPLGLRGLVVGGLLAALMSSLSSLFNSCASLFTVDIYEKLCPGKSEQQLVFIGRLATAVIVMLGLAWIPIMPRIAGGGLYHYLQSVQGYLAPPITAVFLLGLIWKRINARGAFVGLVAGFILGISKLTIQAFFGSNKIADPTFLAAIGDFNFLYFSGVLFFISALIVILVSLSGPAPSEQQLAGLTFASITEDDKRVIRENRSLVDVAMTVGVLALVIGIYFYFSFWLEHS